MRLVLTSDLHGNLPKIPECDLLIIAGDVCPSWEHFRQYQDRWLREDFSIWLNKVPAQDIVWVGGNHDFVLENSKLGKELPGHFLDNEAVTIDSLKIWGSSLSVKFRHWAFGKTESELGEVWRTIPRDIDVLITHGPAYDYGDLTASKFGSKRIGSSSLTNQLVYEQWPNLKLHVFGHNHGGFGEYDLKGIRMMNVSYLNDDYAPANDLVVVDL